MTQLNYIETSCYQTGQVFGSCPNYFAIFNAETGEHICSTKDESFAIEMTEQVS